MKECANLMIYYILEGVNYLLTYVILFQAQISKSKSRILGSVSFVLAYALLIYKCVGMELAVGTPFIPLMIIPIIMLQKREKKWFLLYPIIVMSISIISVGSSFLAAIILKKSAYMLVMDLNNIYVWETIPVIMLLLIHFMQKNKAYNSLVIQITPKQYVVFYIGIGCALISMSVLQAFSSGPMTDERKNIYGFVTTLMSMVFVIMSLWQGIIVNREMHYKRQTEMYEKYMKLQEDRIKEIIYQDEKMRRLSHDMNTHLIALKSFCEGDNNERLRSYVENMMEDSITDDLKKYTGNSTVDAIIRYFEEEASKKEIEIVYEGGMIGELAISEFDICTIVSNLLKNAIEACEKLDEEDKRKIRLLVCPYEMHLFIKTVNSVREKVVINNNNVKTTKQDNYYHGLGMGNVKNIVNKLGGKVKFDCDNDFFTAEIMI